MRRDVFVPECLWCDRRRSKSMGSIFWNGQHHEIHHKCLSEMNAWLAFRAMNARR